MQPPDSTKGPGASHDQSLLQASRSDDATPACRARISRSVPRPAFRQYLQRRVNANDALGYFVSNNPRWIAELPDLRSKRELRDYLILVKSVRLNWLIIDDLKRDMAALRLLFDEYRRATR